MHPGGIDVNQEEWIDPIVEEVRNAGKQLAREAGNDFHTMCENLRKRERLHPERVVNRCPDKDPPGTSSEE